MDGFNKIGNDNLGNQDQMLMHKPVQEMKTEMKTDVYAEERSQEIRVEKIILEDISYEETQKENIQTLRKMEKMTTLEKEQLTNTAITEFDSSTQMQKERRLSGLKKSQRKEISESLKQKDAEKKRKVDAEVRKRNTIEERFTSDFISHRIGMTKDKERVDVTGHERRTRAAKYAKTNLAMKKTMEKDIYNLVQNKKLDIIYENEVQLDDKLQDMRDTVIHFDHLFKERDKELGRQIFNLDKQEENPSHDWPKDLEKPTETKAELKNKLKEFGDLNLLLKGITQNAGATYEVERSNLRAMERARLQLEEDNSFEPSAYTRELIENLDKKIANQKKVVDDIYEGLRKPSQMANMEDRINTLNATYKILSEKANKIKEKRKSLEGLEGEALTKEQEKVDAFVEEIEGEAKTILKNFHF